MQERNFSTIQINKCTIKVKHFFVPKLDKSRLSTQKCIMASKVSGENTWKHNLASMYQLICI